MSTPTTWYADAVAYKESLLLPGDLSPIEFSFNLKFTDNHLMAFYLRNEIVQIACDWQVEEAFRKWLTLEADISVDGLKHGQPYSFKSFNDYLQWIDFKGELECAAAWARLFGNSIMLHLDDQESLDLGDGISGEQKYELGPSTTGRYLSCKAIHPACQTDEGLNGYEITQEDVDQATGKAKFYTIHFQTRGMKAARTLHVDADRVVEFNWKRKQIKYGGDSRVRGLCLIALAEEQMFRRLMKRLHDLAGGFKFMPGVHSEAEKIAMEANLGTDDISSIDLMYGGTVEDAPQFITPDLKVSGEFSEAFKMYTTKYCRCLHMAEKVMNGESQGVQASAKYDIMSTYTEVAQVQEMFRTAMEKCFYKLGLDDTRFTYVPILPEEMQDDFSIGIRDAISERPTPFDKKGPDQEGKTPLPDPAVVKAMEQKKKAKSIE